MKTNRIEKILIYKYSLICITILIILQFSSFLYYSYELLQIKYLSVNILGNILTSFLLVYSYINLKKSLILFLSLIPLNTWYKSVFFITYDFFTIDPFFILLVNFSLVLMYVFFRKQHKVNIFYFGLLCLFLLKFLISLFYIKAYRDIYFIINEFLEPLLFLNIIFISYSVFRNEIVEVFEKSIKGLLFTSFVILITEMILRSGGKPWLFLLYGGRRGYSGTTGDLTAGFGEPVIMGLFASFLFFYFFIFNRNKMIMFYLFFLMLLSIAKSAILAFSLCFFFIFLFLGRKVFSLIPKVFIFIGSIVSIPLLYMIYQRLLGLGKSDNITSMNLGGIEISSDINLIRNISQAISWADPYLDIQWYYQFLLLPFIGGINNIVFLNKFYFIFFISIITIYLIAFKYIIRGNFYTKSVCFVLLLIYCYYGAFGGNPYAYFYEVEKEISLGYVPRSEPTYLFLLLIFSMEISKFKYSEFKEKLKGNKL